MPSDIIVVERTLLESRAFRILGGTAKTVLFDFLMKRTIAKTKARPGQRSEKVILNNGKIEYCYSTAEKNGISRPKFVKALDELTEKGFIDITHLGTGGHKGDKNKYAISERWLAWGTEKFVEKKRPKDTRKGRGWIIYHKRKVQT